MIRRPLLTLLVAVVLVSASGSSCPQMVQQFTQPVPRALPAGPTLAQVMDVVNDNSSRVQSLYSTRATISGPDFPSLSANLAFERPRRFRLNAQSVLQPEMDIGSNDDLFWIWIQRNTPPAVYFCRHDQFATSSIRRFMPIDPDWMAEALGVVTFDPTAQHDGPTPVRGGKLQIRSVIPSATGNITRFVVIDEARGWVLEEHLFDGQTRIASAVASRHQRDPASGATLPRRIEIQWPTTGVSFRIELADLMINHSELLSPNLWAKPEKQGYPNVDLAAPIVALPASNSGR